MSTATIQRVEFFVPGKPQQVGSKNSYVPLHPRTKQPYRKNGRIIVNTVDTNKHAAPWMKHVHAIARSKYWGELMTGPIKLSAIFRFERPNCHYGTGRNAGKVKKSAPQHYHYQVPDQSKLVRAIEDGLTGAVYVDDRMVSCYGVTKKIWVCDRPGVIIRVEKIIE